MKISVKVKVLSREEKITQIGPNKFIVYVKSPPADGKANQDVIKITSRFFGVSKSMVKIITGHNSKNKILEVYK
ncbi:MAG TPA: DUF167 domain-containing protein [bacterium]|nr:DUF167 domain-containing protein [bacterium]HOL35421.1 DUF167 domain-containing protein [bacterium]HPP08800.1 DUF167 domain-containing protein [bacterium]